MTAARLRAAFVAAATAWAALLVAVPFLASRAHASAPASALILGVYTFGRFVCHQRPERSFQLWTAQMPVCARCAGIYFGAVAGAVAGMSRTAKAVRHTSQVARGFSPAEAPRVAQGFSPAGRVRLAVAIAVAPSLLTLVYEWTTGIMPSHAIRAAAGVPIGLVVAWLVVAAAENQVN
jgi:hypothetical protein